MDAKSLQGPITGGPKIPVHLVHTNVATTTVYILTLSVEMTVSDVSKACSNMLVAPIGYNVDIK